MKSQNKSSLKTLNQGHSTSSFYTKSSIIILASALLATTLSFSATAEESKNQLRMEREISNPIPHRIDRRSHQKHKGHNGPQQARKEYERTRTQQSETRAQNDRPAASKFKSKTHADQVTTTGRIKKRINQQQRQIKQLQKNQKKQQKHLQRRETSVSKNRHNIRKNNRHDSQISAKHRDRRTYQSNQKGSQNKNRRVKNKFTSHRANHGTKNQRRYFKARYTGANHFNSRNKAYRNYRTFGHGAYPSLGLIYSFNSTPRYISTVHNPRFTWNKVETFYTPTNRHGYEGEEVAININERVRTIQLKGKKRKMVIDAAYVEFGNGGVRRVPEFEGTLYDNDVINLHFRAQRFVTAIYLDVAANQGRRGKALISVLRAR